eukprot:jgi/Psemu1/1726/gm1.1726_g
MEEPSSESNYDHGNEDFDYIGTGGFLIECGDDNEVLGITKEQSELVKHNCPFFQKCLQHGSDNDDDDGDDEDSDKNGDDGSMRMKEATSRVIRKPDWSLAIVRHFIELLTKGKTTLPNLDLVDGILAAGDQSLVDIRMSSLINYLDPCSKENDFMRLVDSSYFRFRLQAVITSDQWLALLDRGILLYREETNFVVQLYKDQALDRDQSLSRRNLNNQRSEFLVHAERPIEAMYEIQACLSSSNGHTRSNQNGTTEAFSIYFETSESIPEEHHQLIDRLAGGEAYIRTCADAAEHQTEGYTVKASLDVLKRVRMSEDSVLHCTIRVDNPTPDTLGRFINACQKAVDYPGTLGLDASINRYFCRKSMKDVMIILNYMSDYSTSSKICSDFHLYSFSSECESF